MMFIVTNQNKAERLVRLIVSIFLLPAPFIYQNNPFAIIKSIIGGILFSMHFQEYVLFIDFLEQSHVKIKPHL